MDSEKEFAEWVRSQGPPHLRGALESFDAVDAALRYYADELAARLGAVVIQKRGDFPRPRENPLASVSERYRSLMGFLSGYSRIPRGVRVVMSSVCRVMHVKTFTGVMIEVSHESRGYHLLVNLEREP